MDFLSFSPHPVGSDLLRPLWNALVICWSAARGLDILCLGLPVQPLFGVVHLFGKVAPSMIDFPYHGKGSKESIPWSP